MLQLLNYSKCTRLPYQLFPSIFSGSFRFMCDKTKKPCSPTESTKPACKNQPKTDVKKETSEVKKAAPECKKETPVEKKATPDCKKALEVKAAAECKKEAPDAKKATPECEKKKAPESKQKDEMVISGGSKCQEPNPPKPSKRDAQKALCEKLIVRREELDKSKGCQKANKESGGGPKGPCTPCPRPEPSFSNSEKWRNITLKGVLPVVAILTVLIFTTHGEGERPEFKAYPYMYQRTKPFFWGDGNHSRFHNSHWNALPPAGYEDEIDVEAVGKTPETAKEQEQRLKEFSTVHKEWKKKNDKRVAEAKKAEEAAEKEAKKQQAQAEKDQKRQQAEADKEAKKQQAEADKEAKRQQAEAKRQQAEAEKEEKRLQAESEKDRKRQEEEAKRTAKANG